MSRAKERALDNPDGGKKTHVEITYLIDQQCSEQMTLSSNPRKYQGIVFETFTPMIEHREVPLQLSKAQALELIPALQEAIKRMPDPPENCQYPGCLI